MCRLLPVCVSRWVVGIALEEETSVMSGHMCAVMCVHTCVFMLVSLPPPLPVRHGIYNLLQVTSPTPGGGFATTDSKHLSSSVCVYVCESSVSPCVTSCMCTVQSVFYLTSRIVHNDITQCPAFTSNIKYAILLSRNR